MVGPSITLTTMTNLAAFGAGTMVRLPFVQVFAKQCVLGILSMFFLNSIAFTSLLAISMHTRPCKKKTSVQVVPSEPGAFSLSSPIA